MREEKAAKRAKEKEERRKRQRAEKQKQLKLEKQQRRKRIKGEQNTPLIDKTKQQPYNHMHGKPPQIDTGAISPVIPHQQHTEVSHHYTVYDYVIDSPGFYEHSKSHQMRTSSEGGGGSFLFNPLHSHIKDMSIHHIPPPPLKAASTIKIVRNSISANAPSVTATANKPQLSTQQTNREKTNKQLKDVKVLTSTISPSLVNSKSTKVASKNSSKKQKVRNRKTKKGKKSPTNNNNLNTRGSNTKLRPKLRHRHKKRRLRSKRSSIIFDDHDMHHMEYHHNECNHHRIDHCQWPQCNLSCPKFINHFTNQEVDFTDILMQFGLDMSSLAHTLNVDEQTLYRMDRNQLLNLLINT